MSTKPSRGGVAHGVWKAPAHSEGDLYNHRLLEYGFGLTLTVTHYLRRLAGEKGFWHRGHR